MSEIIGRILFHGDTHLNSKAYGLHTDYPRESIEYFTKLTEIAEEYNVTHMVGLGDFTFGRFHSLEYRLTVNGLLERQCKQTDGNNYVIKGNHDSAAYGKTEYEYYIDTGLIKGSNNISIGNVDISMVDYNMQNETSIIAPDSGRVGILAVHDYVRFRDTRLPNFGNRGIILDNYSKWAGVGIIFCGHIHSYMEFKGYIYDESGVGHSTIVNYLSCMARPAYHSEEGGNDDVGHLKVVSVFDDGRVSIESLDVELWGLEKAFNIGKRACEEAKAEIRDSRIDISDVVSKLEKYERSIGNPEDAIDALEVDNRYKIKAKELLKAASS